MTNIVLVIKVSIQATKTSLNEEKEEAMLKGKD